MNIFSLFLLSLYLQFKYIKGACTIDHRINLCKKQLEYKKSHKIGVQIGHIQKIIKICR